MQVMKTLNRSKRGAEASRLPVENAINRWLRRLDLRREARLTPAGSLLDFPEQGRRVFVHNLQSIHE